MESRYEIRVIEIETGRVASAWAPGRSDETNWVEAICARVLAKGVGIFRTEAHVIEDVRVALREHLLELKSTVK